ncbi:MAG: peptidoglycan/xylan/chitin deacetylase (PgdA/CDA1 family) [bacterium]
MEYCADTHADELPYWRSSPTGPQLLDPYTLDANTMRFATPQGFNAGEQFYQYLKDSFDVLYQEGLQGQANMMSIGLHSRLVGRPGSAAAFARVLDYVATFNNVWTARRIGIARHWQTTHPFTD